jgi:hypothetical protein
MFKTVTVKTKRGIKTVKVFCKPSTNAKIQIDAALKNKMARIDPNFKILGVK